MGKYENVVEDCTEAQKYNPSYITLYLTRADAYTKLNKYADAITDCNYVINISPDSSEGFHSRGNVYMSMGKYKNAVADFTSAIKIDNSNLKEKIKDIAEKLIEHCVTAVKPSGPLHF